MIAHAFVAPPIVLGQALAHAAYHSFSWRLFAWAQLIGVLAHALVWSGRAASRRPTRPLAIAMFGSLLGLAAIGALLAFREDRPFMLALVMLAPMLLWADAFPPLALARRGQGHVVQGLGAGVVLVAVGFYVQCGDLFALSLAALAASLLAGVAGGVAVGWDALTRRIRIGGTLLLASAALATPVIFAKAPFAVLATVVVLTLAAGAASLRSRTALAIGVVVLQLGWTVCALA